MGKVGNQRGVMRRQMGVQAALEWAFATEMAQMERDEVGASSGGQRAGVSMEYILYQRFMLGGVAIDTSPGRSSPADDAEVVASVLRATLLWHDASWLADLARTRCVPDCMAGEVPRLRPEDWAFGRGGRVGRRADSRPLGAEGWPPVERRNRKGAVVYDEVSFTPCTWSPTQSQIAGARRRYIDWWGHLLSVMVALQSAGLERIEVTDAMPPMTPWRKGS
ncbi:hypothetical protein [Oceaniovalibus sp. ACAM 378]|uniref:hypothetical protein n=1 Tax=Oceaniovalibus sp. ACAM 378 TaxID=2599923 RepID=UPI0011D55377|nr:hypothetical protein [Oceaniovalibus sp. ACAM 378]TYB83958.1 hypothetical protein FQ320_23340 [Oceaniovalibus sp. ACAM 378]